MHICSRDARYLQQYDISGLKALATEKLKAIIDETQHAAELAEVAILAYGAESATTEICKTIAALVVKREGFAPGGEEGEVIESVVQSYPQLAVDIIKAMRSTKTAYKRPPECVERIYMCPLGCGTKVKAYIPCGKNNYTCPGCRQDRWGQTWAQYVRSS